jgi:beta-galactosidase
MNFRIQNIGLILVLTMLGINCYAQKNTLFNDNWQFVISDANVIEPNNSSEWQSVTLPHTAFVESKVMDGQWQGICWYKKTFSLKDAKDKQLIFHFEGAMNASEFWVNGKKAASHLGGYLPVVFDFTHLANIDGENEIIVRLDNNDNSISGPKPMENLDFNMFGGLYRDTHLIIKDRLHITDPILANKVAGGGVFVQYAEVSKESAIVQIKAHIENQYNKTKSFKVIHELYKNKKLISSIKTDIIETSANKDIEVSSEILVDTPNLWSPDTPDLYTLKTKVISENEIVDEEETRIGIREIKITKDAFLINGQKKFLRGINRHQEYPYIGYAISNSAQYRDAVKIKEAGFDYVRLSHYPHSNAFMDACDELGLVVIDAILGWQYYSDTPEFEAHQFKASRDLIRRDRNHPSVIAWELSLNESNMSESFIDSLLKIGHEEYPGDQCYVAGWVPYGYDVYLQARQHRLEHYVEPTKPYVVSEYGDWEYYAMNAGLNQDSWSNLLQDDRSSRQLLSDGEKRLLQQASNIQEAHNDNFNTPAFADGYWVMYDYNRGYSNDLESSGIMSIDRLPKFSYYFYQSQRDASITSPLYKSGPMVKIASWWTEDSPLDVRVFSNCDEVELLLNGKSLGIQKPNATPISTNLAHPPFTFKINTYEKGELIAKAYIGGKEVSSEIVRSPETPTKIELSVDYSGKTAKSESNDLLFVYAKLVDKNGTVVPQNDHKIRFSIEGDAQLVSPNNIKTEAGIASALVRIGANKKPVLVKAQFEKIESEINITVNQTTSEQASEY